MFDISPVREFVPFEPVSEVLSLSVSPSLVPFAPTYQDLSDFLDIPEFETDAAAIATLNGPFPYAAGNLPYRLTTTQVVKVTPAKFRANIWANLSQAFSYLRRAF